MIDYVSGNLINDFEKFLKQGKNFECKKYVWGDRNGKKRICTKLN